MAQEYIEVQVEHKLDLRNLLNGGLPLEKVGPHLRQAARRALRAGDEDHMLILAKVITSELLRRGDLLRVAVEENGEKSPQYCLIKGTTRLLDLSILGNGTRPLMLLNQAGGSPLSPQPKPDPNEEDDAGLGGIDHMLDAMEDAQKLNIGDPQSGESGVILESVLVLLERFTPQFQLHIMLFDETLINENQNRVFLRDKREDDPNWFSVRESGHSVWIPHAKELPGKIYSSLLAEKSPAPPAVSVAVPLYGPVAKGSSLATRDEAGLLFLLANESWERDTMLRLATRLSRFVTNRWQQHAEVNLRIHIDALTGLFNRGYFNGQFVLLLERAKRSQSPLTLVVGDIDCFKDINTDYNHLMGDQVLKMVARRLHEELRRIDHICRVGGEEFAFILPDTDFNSAKEVLTRLLNAPLVYSGRDGGQQVDIRVTFSYGAVTFPQSGAEPFELYSKADNLMFLSKDRGRNQCHFWSNDGNHLRLLPTSDEI